MVFKPFIPVLEPYRTIYQGVVFICRADIRKMVTINRRRLLGAIAAGIEIS